MYLLVVDVGSVVLDDTGAVDVVDCDVDVDDVDFEFISWSFSSMVRPDSAS